VRLLLVLSVGAEQLWVETALFSGALFSQSSRIIGAVPLDRLGSVSDRFQKVPELLWPDGLGVALFVYPYSVPRVGGYHLTGRQIAAKCLQERLRR
jgi:hypothetical protein